MKIVAQAALLILLGFVMLPAAVQAGKGKEAKESNVAKEAKEAKGAEVSKEGKGECKKPELQSLTLTGQLVSQEKEKKSKDGQVSTITVYYVSTEAGKVHVPQPKAPKGETTAIELADYEGATVTISAQGYLKKSCKEGEMITHIDHVTNIQRVDAPEA